MHSNTNNSKETTNTNSTFLAVASATAEAFLVALISLAVATVGASWGRLARGYTTHGKKEKQARTGLHQQSSSHERAASTYLVHVGFDAVAVDDETQRIQSIKVGGRHQSDLSA